MEEYKNELNKRIFNKNYIIQVRKGFLFKDVEINNVNKKENYVICRNGLIRKDILCSDKYTTPELIPYQELLYAFVVYKDFGLNNYRIKRGNWYMSSGIIRRTAESYLSKEKKEWFDNGKIYPYLSKGAVIFILYLFGFELYLNRDYKKLRKTQNVYCYFNISDKFRKYLD